MSVGKELNVSGFAHQRPNDEVANNRNNIHTSYPQVLT